MTDTLFRTEVLESRQQRWLGGISLGHPVPVRLLAVVAGAAAVAVVALFTSCDYTRRTRVAGHLVPTLGLASLTAPIPGTLVEVRVEEGQRVLAGDILAVVSEQRVTLARGDTVAAMQDALRAELAGIEANYAAQRLQARAQVDGLAAQAAGSAAEVRLAGAERETRRRQLALSEQQLQRLQGLFARRFVTEADVQRQQAAVFEQLAQVQALDRQLTALHRLQAQLAQARREMPARMAALDAAEQRDRAAVSLRSVDVSARDGFAIRAPVTGVVTNLLARVGQPVQASQPVMSLLPAASPLEAHLFVPSGAIGFVDAGDRVLLRYPAFPYQKFGQHGGRVVAVSRSALTAGELGTLLGDLRGGEPHYRIVVALDRATVRAYGTDEPLRPGMRLEADVVGEKRRLWEWALEPLYSISGSLGSR